MPPDAEKSTVSSAPIYEISTGTESCIGNRLSQRLYRRRRRMQPTAPVMPSTSVWKYSDGSIGKLSIPSIGVNKRCTTAKPFANMRLRCGTL